MRICKLFFIGLLACLSLWADDASPVGVWKTIDDNTHKPRGLIRLYEKDGEIFGKIEADFDPKEAQEVCIKCSGDRKNQPVLGMVVMRHMTKHGKEYTGGDILDPETGWVYRCKFALEDGGKKMIVRGYLGITLLGRTQTWYREE